MDEHEQLNELIERLKAPFPLEAHNWKPGATTRDKKRALALVYVDSRQYQDRLDQVDPAWTVSYSPLIVDGHVMVNCTLTVLGITREDVGECSLQDNNAYTSAVAQAFKRACAQFGLGRYLYNVPKVWAGYNDRRKYFTDDGLRVLEKALAAAIGGGGNGGPAERKRGAEAVIDTDDPAPDPARHEHKAKAGGNGKAPSVPPVSEKTTARARAYVLDFGKHKGRTLGQVLDEDEDVDYIRWLSESAKDEKIRAASAYLATHFGGNGSSGNGKLTLDEALAVTMPFGTRNNPELKGKPLEYVEEHMPDLVDWLTKNAKSTKLREAAEVVVASR